MASCVMHCICIQGTVSTRWQCCARATFLLVLVRRLTRWLCGAGGARPGCSVRPHVVYTCANSRARQAVLSDALHSVPYMPRYIRSAHCHLINNSMIIPLVPTCSLPSHQINVLSRPQPAIHFPRAPTKQATLHNKTRELLTPNDQAKTKSKQDYTAALQYVNGLASPARLRLRVQSRNPRIVSRAPLSYAG
jgi:hypothetical protein